MQNSNNNSNKTSDEGGDSPILSRLIRELAALYDEGQIDELDSSLSEELIDSISDIYDRLSSARRGGSEASVRFSTPGAKIWEELSI